VVQKTGYGKSLIYWAATKAFRELGGGPTLIISPLLSLMRDQVDAAAKAGIKAVTINSANVGAWEEAMGGIESGEVDALLVSPERLANPVFEARMGPLLRSCSLVVIDEAHCISDWGFDFRPDYQRLGHLISQVEGVAVLATTATANKRVTADVARQLGSDSLVLRGSLSRDSLHLSVVPGLSLEERYDYCARVLGATEGSGICYVPTVAETGRLAEYLKSQGFLVEAYSGQLDTGSRERLENDLRENRLKAVVATSALGMGYDKPDLGFCVHVGSPGSPVSYYQQIGRAGRALARAEVVLLPAPESDEDLWEWFASSSIPDRDNCDRVMAALESASGPRNTARLSEDTKISRKRVENLLKIMAVAGACVRMVDGWEATGLAFVYDEEKWGSVLAMRRGEADLMRSYATGAGCLMEFLQRALDDEDPGPCGRCSVCTGELPVPLR
jgi:ATP-dependent DNA helicase RecQ